MTRSIDTGTHDLTAHVDGAVGVLTFNRPERRNALSEAMYLAFQVVVPAMADDAEVRVLMVTGAGDAFCAGGDVKGMHDSNRAGDGAARASIGPSAEELVAGLRRRQRWVSLALHQFPKPVVAAVPGPAAGAGLSIALAADIRLAAERAIFVTAFANVGASGDFGGSWFLTRLVGPAKARELYFTSPRLSSAEALEWCRSLADRAPIAMRYMKENFNRAITCDLSTALDAEAAAMVRTMSTADHREAAAAFVEKRPPVFSGE